MRTEDDIVELLLKTKRNYVKKCRYCGKVLEVGHQGRVCDNCHEISMFRYSEKYYGYGW